MATNRPPRRQGHRIVAGLATLLVILLLGPGARPWAGKPNPGGIALKGPAPRLHVAVQQGQLSVDLWEADVKEVFTQIGQKAGIPIIMSSSAGETISAQFTGVTLEQGLRRLLQQASRSYVMRYAADPAGGVAMREVRVWGKAQEGDAAPVVAERAVEEPMAEAGQRFVEALMQHQASPPSSPAKRRATGHVASETRWSVALSQRPGRPPSTKTRPSVASKTRWKRPRKRWRGQINRPC